MSMCGRHLSCRTYSLANNLKVLLHCYALDCASHFLFNPGGTNSLNDQTDLNLMKELSYHDSLRRKMIPVKLLAFS